MQRNETSKIRSTDPFDDRFNRFGERNLCDSGDLFMTEILRFYDACREYVEISINYLKYINIISQKESQNLMLHVQKQ